MTDFSMLWQPSLSCLLYFKCFVATCVNGTLTLETAPVNSRPGASFRTQPLLHGVDVLLGTFDGTYDCVVDRVPYPSGQAVLLGVLLGVLSEEDALHLAMHLELH